MSRFEIAKDNCAAVATEVWGYAWAEALENVKYGFVLATATGLAYWGLDHFRGPVRTPLLAAIVGFVGVFALFMFVDVYWAVRRLKRRVPRAVGDVLPADESGMVAGVEIVGLRGRLFLTLASAGGSTTDDDVVCEFNYVGHRGEPVLAWMGSAVGRFSSDTGPPKVEYPRAFGAAAPPLVPPTGPHAVNWMRGDRYIARYRFWLIPKEP